MSGVQTLKVEPSEDGSRVDRWFKRRFPHVPATMVQKLCRKGQIRVDGGRVKGDSRVSEGQEVRVPPLPEPGEKPARPTLSAEDTAFVKSLVIYEDDELIAFNKPAGLAVQGGSKTQRHLDGLLDAWADAKVPMYTYSAGLEDGPVEARMLLREDDRDWWSNGK